jgi:hypothetical protein
MPEQAARSSAGRRTAVSRPVELESHRGGRTARDFAAQGSPDQLEVPERRTVVIRGQVADRYSPRRRSTASRGRSASYGPLRLPPERVALWAVLLGFALVIVALASAHM